MKSPFNPTKHAALLPQGFVHTHYEADYHDDGDAESGPHLAGDPGFDAYRSENELIIIDEDGTLVSREPIDLEFEAWVDKMASEIYK